MKLFLQTFDLKLNNLFPLEGWNDLVDFSKNVSCDLSCSLLLRQEKAPDVPSSQNLFFFRVLSRSVVLLCCLLKLFRRQLSSYLIFLSTFLSVFCTIAGDCLLFFFTLMLDQLEIVFEIFPVVVFHFHLLISILFSRFPYLLF